MRPGQSLSLARRCQCRPHQDRKDPQVAHDHMTRLRRPYSSCNDLKLPSQAACLKAASESGYTRLSSAGASRRHLVGSCQHTCVRWCPAQAPNVGQRWSCRPVTHGLARKAHQPPAADRASRLGQVEEALVFQAPCACATHGRGVATLLEVLTSFAVPELAHALACAGP